MKLGFRYYIISVWETPGFLRNNNVATNEGRSDDFIHNYRSMSLAVTKYYNLKKKAIIARVETLLTGVINQVD